MEKDILQIWRATDVNENFYVVDFKDNIEGKIILLKSEKSEKILKILFEDTLSYRNTDESFMLKAWDKTSDIILGNTFYKVDSSSYIDFFHEMTLKLYEDWNIIHYAIYTLSDCFDILSQNPPKITWVNDVVPDSADL